MANNRMKGEDKRNRRVVIFELDNYRCLKCRSKEDLTLDHVVPISQGGKNAITNLQTLCFKCNIEKGNTIIDYRHNRKKINVSVFIKLFYFIRKIVTKKEIGKVRFIKKNQYGFIRTPTRKDFYFSLLNSNQNIVHGDRVSFILVHSEKGLRASNITIKNKHENRNCIKI